MEGATDIDRPTAGTVTVDAKSVGDMSQEDVARWRGNRVGIVFQFLPTLTALENAILTMELAGLCSSSERAKPCDIRRIFRTERSSPPTGRCAAVRAT